MVLKIALSMMSGLSQVVVMKTIHTITKSGKEEFEEVVSLTTLSESLTS